MFAALKLWSNKLTNQNRDRKISRIFSSEAFSSHALVIVKKNSIFKSFSNAPTQSAF